MPTEPTRSLPQRLLQPIWIPLLVTGIARLIDVVLLTVLSEHQISSDEMRERATIHTPTEASPGFLGVVANWDGQWYRTIVEDGYPSRLPEDASGEVIQSPWAFLPVFPALVRSLMLIPGFSFETAAVAISVTTSTVALCWLFRLVREHSGVWLATMLVVGINAYPTAPVFLAAYTEGIGLLVIVAALDSLSRQRYGRFAVIMLILGLTRPIAIAFVPVVVLHALLRRRAEGGLPRRQVLALTAAATSAVGGFLLWPLITAAVTGRLDAYPQTQQAWVVDGSDGWRTWLSAIWTGGVGMAVIVVLAVAVACNLTFRAGSRAWPVELRLWAGSYSAFLLVSARPTPSIMRYALLALIFAWPFAEVGENSSRRVRAAILATAAVCGVALHLWWLDGWYIYTPDSSYP